MFGDLGWPGCTECRCRYGQFKRETLEAEEKLNTEGKARTPSFLRLLRECPLRLGEISAGLGCALFPFDWRDGEGSRIQVFLISLKCLVS